MKLLTSQSHNDYQRLLVEEQWLVTLGRMHYHSCDSNETRVCLSRRERKLTCNCGMFQALNGQNVYNGCCALHIDFSKLKRLSVRYNNDKSRDFTNPQLGSDDHRGPPDPVHPGHPGPPPPPPPPGQMPGAGIWGPYPGPGFNMDSGNSVFGFYPGSSICVYISLMLCLYCFLDPETRPQWPRMLFFLVLLLSDL